VLPAQSSAKQLHGMKASALSLNVFRLAFIFARKYIVLLSWQYCMAAEIRPFGWIEPEKNFDLSGSSALLFDLPCRAEKRSSGSLPKI
jgi:hypothetical protein